MKKLFSLLTVLLLYCSAFSLTPVSITGSCGYPWYGAGGHQSIGRLPLRVEGLDIVNADNKWVSTMRALPEFDVSRLFADFWIMVPETASVNQSFTLKQEPTEQNFYYESFFKLQKANGVKNILSVSGCPDWYNMGLNPATGKPYSQRKSACYDPKISPTNPTAWADLAHLCKLLTQYYHGKNLIDYIQVLNEWDFRWNVRHIVTPQEYAVGFRMAYKAIRSVSATQKIMAGATLTADMATARALIRAIDSVFILNGEVPPRDYVYTVNNYFRSGNINQGSGVAATPESVDRYNVFFKPLNDFCVEIGLEGFALTETGYNTSPSNSADALKNKAPALEGYTLEQAQGILAWRTVAMLATLPKCVAVTFYTCKDGFEAEPFLYHGWNYDKDFGGKPDWSAKPGRLLLEGELRAHGQYDFRNYRKKDSFYGVDLYASASGEFVKSLVWTDRAKMGNFDAFPREGVLELPNQSPTITLTSPIGAQVYVEPASVVLSVNASDTDGSVSRVEFYQNNILQYTDAQAPYTYTVTNLAAGTYSFSIKAVDNLGLFSMINNILVDVNANTPTALTLLPPVNHQWKWSDGTNVKIIGHNSPENILYWLNYPFLDWLSAHGANCIYASVNNKESGKPQLSPWINNNPASGFDDAKVNAWVAYCQYWLNKNPKNIVQLVLSEKETHDLGTLEQQQATLQYLATKFAALNGRIITNREEVPNGWSKLNAIYDYQKQVAPGWIRAMHCNTGENPWSGNYGTDRIQALSIQADASAFNGRINTEVPKNANWIAIASEMTGGFQPNDTAKAVTLWNAGGTYNCGVEVYISCCDQTNPASGWYLPYAPVFDKLKQLAAGGTTNPPAPAQYPLNYALNRTRQPNNTLQGAALSAGKIWAYIDVNADIPNRPLKFYYDNVYVNPETGRPYELNGGNGYTVSNGTHTVKVMNALNQQISIATFTVGAVLPPDTIVPPDDTVVVPPVDTTVAFRVQYSKRYDHTQAVTVAGNDTTIAQTSYWWFVETGTGPFTFTLKKNGAVQSGYPKTDPTAPFDLNGNSNVYFQRGIRYTIIITDGTGATRTINITVN